MLSSLGRSGLQVRPLAFGGNVFGWTADPAASCRLLDAFVAGGFSLIDTADVYSRWIPGHAGGESETVIGDWLQQRPGARDKVVIATKLGMDMGEGNQGLSRAYMMRAVDRSLARLKTDYIDLYQAHRDDADTPLEETLSAFAELIKVGKVRAIGASNYSGPRLAEALKISAEKGLPRYETLQPEYNLYSRAGFEGELQGLCAREEIGVIPYFSLASGFLTGKYRSEKDTEGRARGGMTKGMINPRGLAILSVMDKVAAAHSATLAQVALAWLVAKGVAAPIASATSVEQLKELMGSADLSLTAEDVAQLDQASA
ncbi:MAG: aldo/keto reductase [Caulobacteraceae bacterium]